MLKLTGWLPKVSNLFSIYTENLNSHLSLIKRKIAAMQNFRCKNKTMSKLFY